MARHKAREENSVRVALKTLLGLEDERANAEEEATRVAEEERMRLEREREKERLEREREERRVAEEARVAAEEQRRREERELELRLRCESESRARAEVEERMLKEIELQRLALKMRRTGIARVVGVGLLVVIVNLAVSAVLHENVLAESNQRLRTESESWRKARASIEKELADAWLEVRAVAHKAERARDEAAELRLRIEAKEGAKPSRGTGRRGGSPGRARPKPPDKGAASALADGDDRPRDIKLSEDPLGDDQDLFGKGAKKKKVN